jgi:hypothetical protein
MLIETLEDRRLLSAAPVFAHAAKVNPLAAKVNQALLATPEGNTIFTEKLPHNRRSRQSAVLDFLPTGSATAPPFPFTFTLVSGSGVGALSPFPTTFSFSVTSKNPLALFNIKQTIAGEHLNFTGKLKKNLKTLTGVLSISKGGVKVSVTYTGTLTAVP